MKPNLIGIGAPKAGTTWLHRCLAEHPQVFMTPVKETNFLDHEIVEGRFGDYERYFDGAGDARVVGEISTRYLASVRAPERVRRYFPQARLLVSLRDPIEQVYSHYWHLHRQNFHQWNRTAVPATFEEALERYSDRLLEPAYYSKHLRRWFEGVGRDRFFVVLFDDIRDRPREILRDLYAFLGVAADVIPPSLAARGTEVRRGASPRNAWAGRVHSWTHDVLNRRAYHPLKQWIGVHGAVQLKDSLRVRQVLEALFQKPGYPPMAGQTRACLREIFVADVRALEGLLDRDLRSWL